jgi:hypothetical protein
MYFDAKKRTLLSPLNLCIDGRWTKHSSIKGGCFHLGGWAVAQIEKWYPACRMRAIESGEPSTKRKLMDLLQNIYYMP